MGHGELAHLMKEAGVTMKDGGRHEWALAVGLALDASGDHKVDSEELARAVDAYSSVRADYGSITKMAEEGSPFVVAATQGDVDFFRAAANKPEVWEYKYNPHGLMGTMRLKMIPDSPLTPLALLFVSSKHWPTAGLMPWMPWRRSLLPWIWRG